MTISQHDQDPADLHEPALATAKGLTRADWVCQAGFLAADRVAALRAESESLRAAGAFRAAGIGHYAERREDVRGDEILWLGEEQPAPEAERLFREEFAALRRAINAETFLGLDEFEGHYAAYPAGAAYARHLDRFREENRRVVSLVLYLNQEWGEADGGELCLYAAMDSGAPLARIQPRAGTLVCFLSERVPHEVLASQRTRLSLTGWFRRRA
jgi:SM-20-related protein